MKNTLGRENGIILSLPVGTRIALVVVAMAMAVPMITFAQATESPTESSPEADVGAVDTVRPTPASPTQSDSPAGPAPDTSAEVEIQRLINELRREQMDDRAGTIDWWLAAVAVALGFLGIVVVVGGYIGFTRFREIETDAKNSVEQVKSRHCQVNASQAETAPRYR